jgi:hypothetical protein
MLMMTSRRSGSGAAIEQQGALLKRRSSESETDKISEKFWRHLQARLP